MVNALLDTSILIDILRLNAHANRWISQQNIQFGVPAVVYLEALQGSSNKQDQAKALKLLSRFEYVEVVADDYHWAIKQVIQFKLSHNVGAMDCLIAASSYRLQIPLYTMNIKHFTPLLGSLAQKPY